MFFKLLSNLDADFYLFCHLLFSCYINITSSVPSVSVRFLCRFGNDSILVQFCLCYTGGLQNGGKRSSLPRGCACTHTHTHCKNGLLWDFFINNSKHQESVGVPRVKANPAYLISVFHFLNKRSWIECLLQLMFNFILYRSSFSLRLLSRECVISLIRSPHNKSLKQWTSLTVLRRTSITAFGQTSVTALGRTSVTALCYSSVLFRK